MAGGGLADLGEVVRDPLVERRSEAVGPLAQPRFVVGLLRRGLFLEDLDDEEAERMEGRERELLAKAGRRRR